MSSSHRSFVLPPSIRMAAGCSFETEWRTDSLDEPELRMTVRDEEGRLFCFWSFGLKAATALYEAIHEADTASFDLPTREERTQAAAWWAPSSK